MIPRSNTGPLAPRVAVYAIARDEEANVERWAACARDADVLAIADTGSSDHTVERARELGVRVHEISLEPFRFDAARNRALALLPAGIDVCVSLDLDEVLLPGWRSDVESAWLDGAGKLRCWCEWRWSDAYPPLRWSVERIHARHGYRWERPVHERVVATGPERVAQTEIELRHLRDPGGTRPHYLELLRLAVAERKSDGQMAHMLANELRMRGRGEEGREWFQRALALSPGANERLHSLLMLSHLEPEHREELLLTACREFNHRREPWCELAQLQLDRRQWRAARAAAHRALGISESADDYLVNPQAWGSWPERVAAVASAKLGDREWEAHHVRRVSLEAAR